MKAAESCIPEKAVVVGASAGAIDALMTILPQLPGDFPMPVIIVVHLPADKRSLLPGVFSGRCAMAVKEAEDKEVLENGVIYFAPPDYHLLVEPDFSLSLSSEEPVLFSRPSIDVLFDSAAAAFGSEVTGVILTGANPDGAAGLTMIGKSGGRCLIQTPLDAEAPEMPRAAALACPEAQVMSLQKIATTLRNESEPI